jgi:hypothetical protein
MFNNMKRTLAILFSIACCLQGWAQQTQFYWDMYYDLAFTTPDGTVTNADIRGSCFYSRVRFESDPYFYGPVATNELKIVIQTTTAPEGVWMLEKKVDGTFALITEITNRTEHDYYDIHYYDYSQNLALNKKQILRLLDDRHYMLVGLANGSNYISQLNNDFRFADGPAPVIRVSGPVFHTYPILPQVLMPNYAIIALDNRQAPVVLDGLKTVDPFFLPMEFKWVGSQGSAFWNQRPFFTNSEPTTTQSFGLGIGSVELHASDAIATGRRVAYATFIVITPSEAVGRIIHSLQGANLSEYQYDLLIDHLQKASSHFDQESVHQGRYELSQFIRQARKLRIDDPMFDYALASAIRLRDIHR